MCSARWLVVLALLAAPGLAAAQDETDELGVTMTVIEDEGASSEREFVHEIELPDFGSEASRSPDPAGAERAHPAPRAGEPGREHADEAVRAPRPEREEAVRAPVGSRQRPPAREGR